MIRLTWRQFRTQAAVAVGALALVAIFVVVTGPHLRHLYDVTVGSCKGHGNCAAATVGFLTYDSGLRTWLGILVVAVPGILGIFWGAPLVARELEAGTFRLAWTQSVTRTRWLTTKLAVVGLASMLVTGLLSLAVTWWASPADRANLSVYSTFDQRDLVPIGYAAFALAFGVTAGVVIRRTLPAMATTFGVFIGVRLAFNQLVRPHLMAPTVKTLALTVGSTGFGSSNGGPFTLQPNPPNIPNAWFSSVQIVDSSGHDLGASEVSKRCPSLMKSAAPTPQPVGAGHSSRVRAPAGVDHAFRSCLAKFSARYHEVVTYQPARHYWVLQWYELAIYLGAAVLLAAASLWWVRRRLS